MCANTKTAGLIPFVLKGAQPGCFSAANRLEQKKKKSILLERSLVFVVSVCGLKPVHALKIQDMFWEIKALAV